MLHISAETIGRVKNYTRPYYKLEKKLVMGVLFLNRFHSFRLRGLKIGRVMDFWMSQVMAIFSDNSSKGQPLHWTITHFYYIKINACGYLSALTNRLLDVIYLVLF